MDPCEDLVVRVLRKRDRAALEQLFAGVQADIYRLMLSELRNDADAQDAAQETFRQALGTLHNLREPAAFRGWLYRIALRVARAARQKVGLRKRLLEEAGRRLGGGEAPMPDVEREETRARVRAAVTALDDELRETVVLRYERGLKYEEIAQAMDCPEGTVSARLHTAHRRLTEALAGAGVALALAALERELAAAPAPAVPEPLARELRRIASETDLQPAPGVPARLKLAGLAAVALLLLAGGLAVERGLASRRPGAAGTGDGITARSAERPGTGTSGPGAGTDGLRATGGTSEGALPITGETPASLRATLTGHVRDRRNSRPVGGARVWLTRLEPYGEAAAETVTGPDGAYFLEADPAEYELHAHSPEYLDFLIDREIEEVRLGNNFQGDPVHDRERADVKAQYRFRLAPGETAVRDMDLAPGVMIRGRVSDAAGVPLAGAAVDFACQYIDWGPGTNGCSFSYNPDGRTTSVLTGLDGAFEIGPLYPTGSVALDVRKDGYEPGGTSVELDGASTETTIVLQEGATFAGVVVDSLGRPVAGARIFTGPRGDRADHLRLQPVASSAEGTFELRSQPRSARVVGAIAPGYGWTVVRIEGSDPKNLRLVLPDASGTITGIVRDAAGLPLAGVKVTAAYFDARPEGVVARLGFGNSVGWSQEALAVGLVNDSALAPATTTRDDGTFELKGVPVSERHVVGLKFFLKGFRALEREVNTAGWIDAVLEADEPTAPR
ncbi:MAG: sigma-70 family RNA polymerase sigma factor [Planctomycetes bacterium]|nr:sigma-70 family RNA polymerase sigma factor [Planctomycetota bacterium]